MAGNREKRGNHIMNEKTRSYQVVDLSPARRLMINLLDLPGPKHYMFGLLEVDVTAVRHSIAEHKERTGETLSFTAYLTFCLAQAVDEDKIVQGYLKGRKKLVMFEDVHVGIMVERKIGEKRALMGHVIQRANHRSFLEIHQEIRSVQATPLPPGRGVPTWLRLALALPWPLSRLYSAMLNTIMRHEPTISREPAGTVGISSVGMFGGGHGGWGLAAQPYSLALVVGSIAWKPTVVEGRIEPREILNLTVVFDHEIVDGAPAARFTRRLVELIESGYGLDAFLTPVPGFLASS